MKKLADALENNDIEEAFLAKRTQTDTLLKKLIDHEQFFKNFSSETNLTNNSILISLVI